MYKNYIFDLYGTLVDIHTNEKKRYLWEKMAYYYSFNGAFYQPNELKKEYLRLCKEEEVKLTQVDYPEIEITTVFQQLFRIKSMEADFSISVQTGKIFRSLSLDYIRLYDGVAELLGELRKADKKIYLLSNAQKVFTEPEMKSLDLYDRFDGIVFSSEEGCKKPSQKFYQTILDRYHLERSESIMIGNDATADISGAQKVGLDTLYIHSNISPEIKGKVNSTFKIMDGDVKKMRRMIIK